MRYRFTAAKFCALRRYFDVSGQMGSQVYRLTFPRKRSMTWLKLMPLSKTMRVVFSSERRSS
jgi:hypothetical protein